MSIEKKDCVETLDCDPELRRGIAPWMANLIALGGIIGSCYFVGSGYLIQELGISAAFAFMLGGLIVYVIMQSFAELLVNVPRRGSFISYSREFISPIWAVATGWTYWFNWICYIPSEALAGALIMNQLFGQLAIFQFGATNYTDFFWAVVFLLIITIINLKHVEGFGAIESTLALLKIFAVTVFAIIALLIVIGAFGEPVGFSIAFPDGHISYDNLFPAGWFALITYLVVILVNFQGSEIVGLAASETKDPTTTVPKACRQVVWRIIGVYVIPITFLVLILSRDDSGLDGSMFAAALTNYSVSLNMPWLGWLAASFALVVLTAAFSCANSGFYGTVRALYALAVEGMAPKSLKKINKSGVPGNATVFTLICCWVILLLNLLIGATDAFLILISISGFTGTICWMSIVLAQVSFRRRIYKRGYTKADVKAPALGSPWSPLLLGFVLMTVGLFMMLFSGDPILIGAFIASVAGLLIPMAIFYIMVKMGKTNLSGGLAAGDVAFDELYPDKNITK